jgi:alkylresorcinol/alkylpyrone synthase
MNEKNEPMDVPRKARRRVLPPPPGKTTVLTDIRRYHDDKIIKQAQLNEYIAWLMATAACVRERPDSEAGARKVFDETAALMTRFGVKDQHIHGRVMMALPCALWEGGELDPAAPFPSCLSNLGADDKGRPVTDRMRYYAESLDTFLSQAYPIADSEPPPDDIVHVTCTGYEAPSAVERMLSRRRWTRTTVTNCFHMGCYAAFPGVRIANGILSAAGSTIGLPKRRIDVVHTELVSIHLEVDDVTPGNLVTMSLFGDGFIRYSLVPSHLMGEGAGLELRAATESVLPDSLEEMTWDLTPHAFHMYLSPDVPLKIRDHLPDLLEALAGQVPCDPKLLLKEAVFAIHPGGPRIISFIQEALGLRPEQCAHSWEVLRQRGNMSSATVPHIWKAILEDDRIPDGTPVVSMAFGPGLTAAGLVAEKVRAT